LRDLALAVTLFRFIVGEHSCGQNSIVSTPFLVGILAHKKENCNREQFRPAVVRPERLRIRIDRFKG
jgi:hypothetical protein